MAAIGPVTAAEFGRDALDFSANVSPLGLPEGVARAITAALPTADRYPDPLCREPAGEAERSMRACRRSRSSAAMGRQTLSSGWSGPQKPRRALVHRTHLCGVRHCFGNVSAAR